MENATLQGRLLESFASRRGCRLLVGTTVRRRYDEFSRAAVPAVAPKACVWHAQACPSVLEMNVPWKLVASLLVAASTWHDRWPVANPWPTRFNLYHEKTPGSAKRPGAAPTTTLRAGDPAPPGGGGLRAAMRARGRRGDWAWEEGP